MVVRRLTVAPARAVAGRLVRLRSLPWPDNSRLFAVGDRGRWSVDEDATNLEDVARRLGLRVGPAGWARFCERQAVFLTSHFEGLGPYWLESSHRLGTAYLHGRPGTPGYPEFDRAYGTLRRNPERLARIQVTHEEMHALVLSAGVPAKRVFRLPIGIDLESFPPVDGARRAAARRALGLGDAAFVVGSFQKDGIGWGEGFEPKLIKGPDVLVNALEEIRRAVPELVVLLTGPARGYVRSELERLGVTCLHTVAEGKAELARAYHALDVYVVPSRQEGGPKGVLEALAAGVPLVSTRVGQATEIVTSGRDGLLVEVEDVEAITDAIVRLHGDSGLSRSLAETGRATAERYSHVRLDALWAALLSGFVEGGTS